jgi:vancomycin resistance protein VanW
MYRYAKQIINLEKTKRVALTRKFPAILPIVLESKRLINTLGYKFNPAFSLRKETATKWFNITEHSSPLYRKYNKVELDEGKIKNIRIAIKNIDGIVIPPGKIFSFWKFVGRPLKKNGFERGLVLSAGQLKEDIGGGLCQLSNLMAYMFACTECDFVERKHHSRDVFPDSGRIIPFASGATVFFNLIDLKVKNTYPFPIRINLRTTDTQLRGSISCPVQLDNSIKLEEEGSKFIRSLRTGVIYRCNELFRVMYDKRTKKQIKKNILWTNIAEVMYDTGNIEHKIDTLDANI